MIAIATLACSKTQVKQKQQPDILCAASRCRGYVSQMLIDANFNANIDAREKSQINIADYKLAIWCGYEYEATNAVNVNFVVLKNTKITNLFSSPVFLYIKNIAFFYSWYCPKEVYPMKHKNDGFINRWWRWSNGNGETCRAAVLWRQSFSSQLMKQLRYLPIQMCQMDSFPALLVLERPHGCIDGCIDAYRS